MNKKITFHCTTVTPMFISGADGAKAELRVPSIKGLIRFWWRAMNAHLSLDEMRKKEADIFGGVTDKPKRSAVTIRLDKAYKNINENKSSKKNILKKGEFKGIEYLLYSVVSMNEKNYIDENFNFSITFASKNENALDEVIKAFGMLVNFGGVGTRSRRGAGSFVVNKTDPESLGENDFLFNLKDITSKDELIDHYRRISKLLSCLPKENKSGSDNENNSGEQQSSKLAIPRGKKVQSTLKNSYIHIYAHESDWKSALNKVGETFACYRRINQNRVYDTPNFGFPIRHKNRDIFIAKSIEHHKSLDRRSSPLIFKVVKVADNLYFPIIIWLKGELVPDGYVITKNNVTLVGQSLEKLREMEGNEFKKPSTDLIKNYLITATRQIREKDRYEKKQKEAQNRHSWDVKL